MCEDKRAKRSRSSKTKREQAGESNHFQGQERGKRKRGQKYYLVWVFTQNYFLSFLREEGLRGKKVFTSDVFLTSSQFSLLGLLSGQILRLKLFFLSFSPPLLSHTFPFDNGRRHRMATPFFSLIFSHILSRICLMVENANEQKKRLV
jgi:hypothetical protein